VGADVKVLTPIVIIAALLCSAPVQAQSELLIKSLIEQESDGNDRAFNKKENAVGCLQIRPGYFKDAQEADPSLRSLKHEDCYDREVSIRVFKAYMKRYKPKNDEEAARKHNGGGPKGHLKDSTLPYWRSVQEIMDNGGKKPQKRRRK
jgi:hypothetical protein